MTTKPVVIAQMPLGMLGKGQADADAEAEDITFAPSVLMFTEDGVCTATGLDGTDFTLNITVADGDLPYIHPVVVTGLKTSGFDAPNLQRIVL